MSSSRILQRYCALRHSRRVSSAAFSWCFYRQQRFMSQNDRLPEEFLDAQKMPFQRSTELHKEKRPPFLKNLFIGKFNTDMLTFPEALKKDHLALLDKRIESVHSHLKNTELEESPESRNALDLMYLKRSGILGMQIPVEYGGLNLSATEVVRIGESMSTNPYLALTCVAHHSVGLKGILLHGNEKQKSQYLPKLASGELLASFCMLEEESGSDAALMKTNATETEDATSYILNGTKILVPNGEIADLFVVIANAVVHEKKDEILVPGTVPIAMIVPKDLKGITCEPCVNTAGIPLLNTCTVRFENTSVPKENVLGNVNSGFQVAADVLGSCRLGFGMLVAGALRQLLNQTVKQAIEKVKFSKPLMEFHMIQEKISKMACAMYAMESMSYLTAGIIDGSLEPDYFLEATAEKIFSHEFGRWCIEECSTILEERPFIDGIPFDTYLRDLAMISSLEGSTDVLRVYLALIGINHVGKEKADDIRKFRNSVFFPHFVIKKRIKEEWRMLTKSASNLDLPGYLHPSLTFQAHCLEECLELLDYSAEVLLRRYGKSVPDYHMELKRLADIAIHIYLMTACLGRASRSYCIGLQNADHEIMMAETIVHESVQQVRKWAEEIRIGPITSFDVNHQKIASCIFKFKGYAAEHALTRNW